MTPDTTSSVVLAELNELWPGSPQQAVFRVETAMGAEHAATLAKQEAKRIGLAVKTRGYTVELAPGVWHVELRVRKAVAS